LKHLVSTRSLLRLGINAGDVGDEIADTAGVTVLVVVLVVVSGVKICTKSTNPRDKLDEVVVEGDTSLGVEDGGLGGADEVGRDNFVLGVT